MARKKLWIAVFLAGFTCMAAADDDNDGPGDSDELDAVIVTSPLPLKRSETATPVTVLTGDELEMKMGHTIGETLKSELGISSASFGPGVGTPVIRGQGGPRVRVLQNGIGSNDVSQLSPDHATSIEPSMAERIEVLRGPATLLYGSGAIGGVVNIIDNRVPTHLVGKPLRSTFEQRYDSVYNESSTALKAEGDNGHLAYHLDGLYRDRGDMAIGGTAIDANAAQSLDPTLTVITNTHGYVPNTFAQTLNGSAGVSYVGERGFAGVAFNQLHNTYGIPPDGGFSDGFADPNTRIDMQQKKYDFKSELNQPFAFAEKLAVRLGYTDYFHTELDGGVPGIPYGPGTAFSNKTFEGRVELTHKPIGPLQGVLGFQALSSNFAAFDYPAGGLAPGEPLGAITNIVPTTLNQGFGLFGLESVKYGSVTYQAGLRVEADNLNPNLSSQYTAPLNTTVGTSYRYLPVSASASAVWKVDDANSLNVALTRSQRAPQVQELFSNGYHDATRSYELGDPNLQMESSYNLDLGYTFKNDMLRAELNLFSNWVNDYIFQRRTGEFVPPGYTPGYTQLVNTTSYYTAAQCLQESGGTPCTTITQSMQAGAIFRGYEGKLVFPVMETAAGLLELTLFSDYTNGQLIANGGATPRMPPLRYGFEWNYTERDWSGNIRLTRGEAQDHPGANDTTTPGYFLLNAGGEYRITAAQETSLLLFMKLNNLLNENIRNSVSYLRNFTPQPGRGVELGLKVNF